MKIPCDPGRDESWITADCKAAGAPSGATATAGPCAECDNNQINQGVGEYSQAAWKACG